MKKLWNWIKSLFNGTSDKDLDMYESGDGFSEMRDGMGMP